MSALPAEPVRELLALRQADGNTLYRLLRQGAAAPQLLAVCASGAFQANAQRRMEHAWSFRDRLDPRFATVPLRLLRHGGLPAMLLTDPGGLPLHLRLGRPLDPSAVLAIGAGIARALGGMHARQVVHKDVRPCNILVDDAGGVFLTGFGGASLVSREAPAEGGALELSDSLPYMSPEQTGRMNRSVDTRSDLYSLGVTLYEMACGVLPFQAVDALEWVHCHIAREPLSPAERVPGMPAMLSRTIERLLQKTADDRYQTAAGVEADLRRCAADLAAVFEPGQRDVPERLLVAEQLYGREGDIAQLMDAWRGVAASGQPGLVMVSGYSGIGKSAVVGEFRKALVAQRAPFAAGKFEQHKRDIPYATVAQALAVLVTDLLGQDEAGLFLWRERLLAALGAHGQIVVDLVPELELVIGRQPALTQAPPPEGSLRFQKTIQRFVSAFGSAGSPLVLFLDDLQWLDTATLDLLAAMVTSPDLRHVLLVGAYRSNEVDNTHPLAAMLATLRKAGVPPRELALRPLTVDELRALVARSLCDGQGRSADLAALVWRKTQGNPFFANHFLAALGDEKLIWFDRETLCWRWNMAGIQARNHSQNVAELMAEKLSRLPAPTRHGLALLACLGASATVATLARVAGLAPEAVHGLFSAAELAGLVSRGAGHYRFMHDRIQEAAYALLPAGERAARHLDIARRLGRDAPAAEALVFERANQYARAEALLLAADERMEVAALYLAAARRAVAETAWPAALGWLAGGERLLPPDAWSRDYRLCFELSRQRAECEFLVGEPQAADERLAVLAGRARSLLDKASVTWLRVTVCLGLDQSARAIATCLDFLAEVDTPWPPHPGRAEVEHEYRLLLSDIGGRPVASLIDLPPMADPLRRAVLDVLAAVLPPAFFSDENLVCLVLCRMARLGIAHGNSDASPLAWAYLGMMAGPYFDDYDTAFAFGKLGFELVERGTLTRYRARVYMCFAHHVIPWARDIRSGQALLRRAFVVSRETGDLTYAGFSSCCLVTSLLGSGEPLEAVCTETREKLAFVTAAKFGLIVDIVTAQQRLVATLRGATPVFGCFDDAGFDEAAFELHLDANRSLDIAACWYWIRKAQARFMAGASADALRALARAEPLLWTSKGHFELAEFHFHGGLIRAACCEDAPAAERPAHLAALAGHRLQIDRWARHCPENFASASALLAAEAARLGGDQLEAMRLFEAASAAARAAGFPHHEALALELSARFHAGHGRHALAGPLIRSARQAYERWGAIGKARQLDRLHAELRDEPAAGAGPGGVRGLDTVDVDTLLRISRAVAAEKGLARLMRTLMGIALEHAGADRGLLVLPRGEHLRIEARAGIAQRSVEVLLGSSEASGADLPLSVLHFAIRTRGPVLIDDARLPGPFARDPYLLASGARSVLCLPLLRQGELTGLLYLENTLAGFVFTPQRVAMLGLLASTAATTMENASLEEKESLLQEVHHRVKNNLQLISSLLSLQASRIADPAVAELFADSRNRVRSMALVHENLYRAGNFARVPMAEHLGTLCAQLARAYGVDDSRVRLRTRIEDIQLGLNRAVSCGLIVNELVSNALKHAFPGERQGEIRVALQATPDGRYALSVSDDGIGLPADIDLARTDSLGLQLVDDLAAQLHGELAARRDAGTRFVVTFDGDVP